jgi:hypothetical protein
MLKVVQEESDPNQAGAESAVSLLDQIVRDGARQMLAAALQAEVAAYVEQFVDEVDEQGHRLVVRNGHHAPREVTTAAGAVPVRAPRVNDKRTDEVTGERRRFSSAILPAWSRKSPRVAGVLPLLYLHGLSSSDFGPALKQFLGTSHGLSPATITRLTKDWQDEAAAFNKRSLKDTDYVYIWVDGIHLKVASSRTRCACWWSSASAPTAPRSWSRSTTGTGSPPSPGPTCSAPASAAAWLRRCCGRRRGARVLGCGPRGVPRHQRAAVLVPQDRQRPQLPAQVGPAGREGRARADLERRRQGARRTGVAGRAG